MIRGTTVYVNRTHFGRVIEVLLVQANAHDEVTHAAQPVAFVPVSDPGDIFEPTLSLRPELAQQLIDGLWDAGLRPTQGQQSEGQFAAQGRHLNDMRSLVAALAKVELPK